MAVYIILAMDACGEPQYAKVGYAHDPQKRLKGLQTGSPMALQLMAVQRSGTPSTEKHFHAQLKSLGAERGSTQEWFACGDVCALFLQDWSKYLEWDVYLNEECILDEAHTSSFYPLSQSITYSS